MQVCPSCGESSPDRFSECPFCGHALAGRSAAREERKVLTVVFCDLKDSTVLGERLDPESMSEVLDLYFTATTRVLKRHGGAIQKFIGDAVVAAFGLPVIHEDDALRAVRAAVEMGEALGRLNRQLEHGYGIKLETRMGVHTGEVVIRMAVDDQQVLTGDTLNTGARLEQAAGAGEILLGEPTYRLVRDAVEAEALPPLELKGKSDRVPAYRLIRVFGDEQASRHHDAPIVGRESELAVIAEAYGQACHDRRCHLVTVLGEAGVGKSRLVRAFLDATQRDAMILRGRCLSYGDGMTFAPLLPIIHGLVGIEADDPADVARARLEEMVDEPEITRRVASALGWADEDLPVAELFWGIRELLERQARTTPLVLVIDDIHWATPTLLELLAHLAETVDDAPILILCTARPDMLEANPGWSAGERSSHLELDRLPDGVAGRVLANLLDGVELPEEVQGVILRAAEGNPLFVEQLVSMLIDSGVLVEVDGAWRASRSIERVPIPPSIQALLTARLDMLDSEERTVIEPASVMGVEFPSSALRDLVPGEERDHVSAHLEDLTRRQLVRPSGTAAWQGDDHRFHHALIRDSAYQRVLKRGRAELHERFAGWLEQTEVERGRAGEQDEIVGYHLEQAHRYRLELGTADAAAGELGRRGAEKLAAAGRRTFVQGDLPAADSLLTRAVALLPVASAQRMALLSDLGEALMERGAFERAREVLAEGATPAAAEAAPAEAARTRLVRLMVDLFSGDEQGWAERVATAVAAAEPIFERAGHHVGLATASRLRYNVEATALRFDAAVSAADATIRRAEAAGDLRQQRRGAVAYAIAALLGPTPVPEGITRLGELAESVDGDRRTQAVVELCLAQLMAMDGQLDRARAMAADATGKLNELGQSVLSSSTSTDTAPIELLAGDIPAAEELLRRDLTALEAIGETYLRSTVAGLLARVLVVRGATDEAERLANDVREIAADDDVDAQVLWRAALARCLAPRAGEDALKLANEAVALTDGTSAPVLAGQALTDRALVLRAVGREADADADLARAEALYEAKGSRLAAEGTRALRANARPSG